MESRELKPDPAAIPWGDVGADIVIESAGRFTDGVAASAHLKGGARKVIISAPAKGDVPTFVLGVNDDQLDPDSHDVFSNGSCTTKFCQWRGKGPCRRSLDHPHVVRRRESDWQGDSRTRGQCRVPRSGVISATSSLPAVLRSAPLVSADIVGNPYSSIFDAPLTEAVGNQVKVLGWYDNEWGFSNRLVEFSELIAAG